MMTFLLILGIFMLFVVLAVTASVTYFMRNHGYDSNVNEEVEAKLDSNELQRVELSPKEYRDLMKNGVVKPEGYTISIIKENHHV